MMMMGKQKPQGYWKVKENVDRDLASVIEQLGRFPKLKDFRDLRKTSLATATRTHYGNIADARAAFGFTGGRKPNGYWTEEKTLEELKPIVDELKRFPTLRELVERKRQDLHMAISKNGGQNHFKRLLGITVKINYIQRYADFKNVELDLRKIITDLGYVPSSEELSKIHSPLTNAIYKFHGSYIKVKERLGFVPKPHKESFWNNRVNLYPIIDQLVETHELSEHISQEELEPVADEYLHDAIVQIHGGYEEFLKMYKKRVEKKKPGFWKNKTRVKEMVEDLIERFGEIPSVCELEELELGGLVIAIRSYHGGIEKVREEFGFSPKATLNK